MPEYDLVIRGGTIVDGTGIPQYRADLAVKNGRVAMISGRIGAGGAQEIDASGCIVAPGAIDLHTHYDAQVNWDPYCSLSGWFGVTSLTIGQCGFGFAPTRPKDREQAMQMMDRIEAIPLASMRSGMRWDWETFPEYLDSLDRQGLGVNVGALFPFSPLRGYVMGMKAAREATSATDAQLNQMKQSFYEAMRAGAFGFSLSKNMEDKTEDGSPLPSHVASDEEFLALAEVLGQFGVGHMGLTLGLGLRPDERQAVRALMAQMMRVSGRPLHYVDVNRNEYPVWIQSCREEGLTALVQAGCVVGGVAGVGGRQFKLAEYNLYDFMPNWVRPLVGSPEERAAKLKNRATRDAMKRDVEEWADRSTDWSQLRVLEVVYDRNRQYEGLSIKELAELTGKHALDAFLDLSLDEGLQTEFELPRCTETEESLKLHEERLKDPYAHISMSDGGAHTRYTTLSHWPVFWLAYWIRDREIMTLEQAHYKMSAYPAWLADFKDRGTLRTGNWADIIVYNLEQLGFLYDKPGYANDFPGGERRLIQKPTGLRNIVVNGKVTFEENRCTGALPGSLLRSYDMVG